MKTTSQRNAMAALSLCVLLPSLGMSIANVALPALSTAFDASFAGIQWVVVAYLLASTVLVVFAGRLGDRAGRRRMLVAGTFIFAGGALACGLAPTLEMLVAARALQGVGAALMLALSMAMVGETMPKEKVGGAMGVLGTMSAVGTAAGPALGGALVSGLGWRSIFLVAVPLALVAGFLAWKHLPRDVARESVAQGSRNMLAPTASLAAPLAMSAIVAMVMMATLVAGPFHLSQAMGLDLARVGIVMLAGPLVAALAGVPAGRLVDRFGGQAMVKAGLVGLVIASLALCAAPLSWGIAGYAVPLAILAANYALFQAANNTAVMKGVEPGDRGLVSGMLNLSRNLGLIGGASAMGNLFAATGLRVTFAIATALLLLALSLAFRPAGKGVRPLFLPGGKRGLTP